MRATSLIAVGLAAGALALGACSSQSTPSASVTSTKPATSPASASVSTSAGGDAAPSTSEGTPAPSESTGGTSGAADGPASGDTVHLAIAGDANTDRRAARALKVGIGPMSTYLKRADVAIVNLETLVVPDRTGLVEAKKNFRFVTTPTFLDHMAAAGIDVAPAANNHTMDFGVEGMRRMLAMKSPVPLVGVGNTPEEAFAPWTTTVRGRKVVVFSGNDIETDGYDWSAHDGNPGQAVIMHPEGEQRMAEAVRAARAADPKAVVVVYLHWGIERDSCQGSRQERLARLYADAGADAVVGTHAHRLMPYTTIKAADGRTTAVAYGVGNFVFNTPSPESSRTGVLDLTIPVNGAPVAQWHPARIVDGVPTPLTGAALEKEQRAWDTALERCAR